MQLLEKENKRASGSALQRIWHLFIKRLVDILLGILLLLFLSPLFVCICVVILKKEGKPVFYREKCTGKHGQSFIKLQFRTLSNPSRLITALPPYPYPLLLRKGTGDHNHFHRESYRTVTATGRWLKKYKLNKLPLLFNAIKGDISFFCTAGKQEEKPRHDIEFQSQR